MQKKNFLRPISIIFLLVLLSSALSGCEIIGGIFKAGVWVGILVVVVVLALIFFLFRKK